MYKANLTTLLQRDRVYREHCSNALYYSIIRHIELFLKISILVIDTLAYLNQNCHRFFVYKRKTLVTFMLTDSQLVQLIIDCSHRSASAELMLLACFVSKLFDKY